MLTFADSEGLAAFALVAARSAALVVFLDMLARRRRARHVLLAGAWTLHVISPVVALSLGPASPAFPALAVAGTVGMVAAAAAYFRRVPIVAGSAAMGIAAVLMVALGTASPALLKIAPLAAQTVAFVALGGLALAFRERFRRVSPDGYRALLWLATLSALYAICFAALGHAATTVAALVGALGLNALAVAFFLYLEVGLATADLIESEALNRTIIASIPQGLSVKDTDGVYVAANEAFAAHVGLMPTEVVGRTDLDLFPPELADEYRADDAAVVGSVSVLEFDAAYEVDGDRRVAHTRKAPLVRDGEVFGVVGVYEDVTYDRMAEELLRESEARFRTTFECAGAGISHVAFDGTVLLANSRLAGMLAREPEELVGGSIWNWVHPDHAREDADLCARLVSGEMGTISGERRYVRRDGSTLWVVMTVALARDLDGKPAYFVRVSEDISELKAAQEELREHRDRLESLVARRTKELIHVNDELRASNDELKVANRRLDAANEELQSLNEELMAVNEELDAANERLQSLNEELTEATRAKNAFMASVSHELRTPLNSIIGFTHTLLDGLAGPLNEEQSKQLTMVGVAARRQLELVDMLLDLERIAAGAIRPEPERFELGEVLDEVAGLIAEKAEQRGLELRVEHEIEPPTVLTDRRYVWEILVNLATNAIKYTESGGIRMAIVAPPRDDLVAVSVADTGCGVSAEDMERIFEPFEQGGAGRARHLRDSVGLGLAIASGLARALGGSLEVESAPGEGSVFTLIIRRELAVGGEVRVAPG